MTIEDKVKENNYRDRTGRGTSAVYPPVPSLNSTKAGALIVKHSASEKWVAKQRTSFLRHLLCLSGPEVSALDFVPLGAPSEGSKGAQSFELICQCLATKLD